MNCVCKRCSHKWVKRVEAEPKYCPNCKQPKWQTPARAKKNDSTIEINTLIDLMREMLA